MTKQKCMVVNHFDDLKEAQEYAIKNDCGIYYNPAAPENGYAIVKWVPV